MLNRVREAKQTEADIKQLQKRVRPHDHPDLQEVNLYIVCRKIKCGILNEKYLNSLPGDEIILKATHFQKGQKKYTPFIDKKRRNYRSYILHGYSTAEAQLQGHPYP